MGKCKFSPNWLLKEDLNGTIISSWARKGEDDSSVFCIACDVVVCVEKGFCRLIQHSKSKKHVENFVAKFGKFQLKLDKSNSKPSTSLGEKSVPTSDLTLISTKDDATTAELIWTLKCVGSNYSLASTTGIVEVFRAMFGSKSIPNGII